MSRVEIEKKISFQKEKIETLEETMKAEREEMNSLLMDLEASLREELTEVLAENERMEERLKQRA